MADMMKGEVIFLFSAGSNVGRISILDEEVTQAMSVTWQSYKTKR